MLFQYKANEELVRSEMGGEKKWTIDKDGNRMLSSDYSSAPMVWSKEEGSLISMSLCK
jgi:hypothetical protein